MFKRILKLLLCAFILSVPSFASSVTLHWTASITPNVDHYKVYRALVSGGPYTLMGIVTADKLTFTNGSNPDGSPLVEGQTYCYVATAMLGSKESIKSNEKCVTITTPLPPGMQDPTQN